MKQLALLALVLMMFAGCVYAQPDEEVILPPDSLQNPEPDSLLITEE